MTSFSWFKDCLNCLSQYPEIKNHKHFQFTNKFISIPPLYPALNTKNSLLISAGTTCTTLLKSAILQQKVYPWPNSTNSYLAHLVCKQTSLQKVGGADFRKGLLMTTRTIPSPVKSLWTIFHKYSGTGIILSAIR